MAYCAETVATVDGDVIRLVSPQPGSLVGCAIVVPSDVEWTAVQSGSALWMLDSAQGTEIATAVVGLLAVGWIFRTIYRFINEREPEHE